MISFKKLSSFLFVAAFVAAFGPVSGASAQAAQISWTTCPKEAYPDPALADALYPTLQCGTFKVPYDYGKPNGKQFTLALQKLPASGTKIGTLFTNPGGPGSPGRTSWTEAATIRMRNSFDLIGFDPRGVGETRPAFDCEKADEAVPKLPPVDWVQIAAVQTILTARANRACQRKSADFIAHVGTNNVVRDLDAMRAAVGDAKLNFWGMSYGSRIGYVYAYRYPRRVRAIILDGPISPNGSWANFARGRSGSNDKALRFIRSVSPATYAAVISTRNSLFASRLDIGTARLTMGGYEWLNILTNKLSKQDSWPQITALAKQVAAARIVGPGGDEARAALREELAIADAEDPDGVAADGGANDAINCADYADRPSARQRARIVRNAVSRAPVFGGLLASVAAPGCTGFTFRPDPVPRIASRASLARVRNVKLAISDSTADAATPLGWGRAMARAFPSAFEVTQETGNHVNYLQTESDCVDDPLREYLLTLKTGPRRTTCLFTAPEGLDMSAVAAGKRKLN